MTCAQITGKLGASTHWTGNKIDIAVGLELKYHVGDYVKYGRWMFGVWSVMLQICSTRIMWKQIF